MAFSAAQANHPRNWLLAAPDPEVPAYLEPHLEIVMLPTGTIFYEAHDQIHYTYFPHDAIVCLMNVMEEGQFVEVTCFGLEGLFGLIGAFVSREAFGCYKVQVPGTACRIAINRMQQAMQVRPS